MNNQKNSNPSTSDKNNQNPTSKQNNNPTSKQRNSFDDSKTPSTTSGN